MIQFKLLFPLNITDPIFVQKNFKLSTHSFQNDITSLISSFEFHQDNNIIELS